MTDHTPTECGHTEANIEHDDAGRPYCAACRIEAARVVADFKREAERRKLVP